mgnify:CR=1 FL=1
MTTKGHYNRFYSLLNLMPSDNKEGLKEQLVWQYSNMLTVSLKEFAQSKPDDYKRMLADMQSEVNRLNPARFQQQETKRLRSAILHRLQKYGVDTTNWAAVNRFLEQPRIAGKRLYNLTIDEMNALIPKLENILHKQMVIREEERELTLKN